MRKLVLSRPALLVCLVSYFMLLEAPSGVSETWREIQSPHFRVVTDGSEREGRAAAKEFEQMRSVLAARFNNPALETGAPLLIMAVHDQGMHDLGPVIWKDHDRIGGEFFKGWERQYALIRLDSFGDLNQAVVFHEYTHSVLHANLHWLPTWLDEGMAEFYAYTRFEGDRTFVGAPSIRLRHVRSDPLIPVSEMLTATEATYAKDERRDDLFYGEAWAMVHYMSFGPDMGIGKLNRFFGALEKGTPQREAFQQVYGDPKGFEKNLSLYISRFTMLAGILPPADGLDAKTYPVRVLAQAEVDYSRGAFAVGIHDEATAKTRLRAAEAADPALAGPHEELGFLEWRQGHDDEAKSEWKKAVIADPSCYRATFALLMSATLLKQQDKQQLEETERALDAIREKAPKFAPAIVELALIQWRLGHMNAAFKDAVAAEKLEPWRAGYRILAGYLLLQGHQPKLAAEFASEVAARWPGADHDEAVDLWDLVPAAERGDKPALTLSLPADSTVVRATIVNSFCDKSGLSLILQPTAPHATEVKVAAMGRFESGFSDTLWVGEDHYTTCFHLAGLPAVVSYKIDATGVNKLVALEVRDDLPQLNPSASAPKSPEIGKAQPSVQ